ncbi:MAG: hypothetical protein E7043_06615 [Lentisphaerae bacterium]|nr:hypothetical protein [Lentisphaerota bacterium]
MSKIQCLTCGGMTEVGDSLKGRCEYCGCAISLKRISSFNGFSTSEIPEIKIALEKSSEEEAENKDLALGLCYLKTGNFILARKKLFQVIENVPECSEAYYYYSIALLNGRELSDLTMREARQLTEFLKTSMILDESFIFPKVLYALICIEYYQNNNLLPPDDGEALLAEIDSEVDREELEFFKEHVKTDII